MVGKSKNQKAFVALTCPPRKKTPSRGSSRGFLLMEEQTYLQRKDRNPLSGKTTLRAVNDI